MNSFANILALVIGSLTTFLKNLNFFFKNLIEFVLFGSFWCADVKNNFKKMKKIIDMHFDTKSYLKNTRNHTAKHADSQWKKMDCFSYSTQFLYYCTWLNEKDIYTLFWLFYNFLILRQLCHFIMLKKIN